MNEVRPISIAEQAAAAARKTVEAQEVEPNPHPEHTDAARAWQAAYERYLLLYSSDSLELEGGA